MAELRVVPDTNVVVASKLSTNDQSANVRLEERWLEGDLDYLYSLDTFDEYGRKLRELGVSAEATLDFLTNLAGLGEEVAIEFFHVTPYPEDPDDIAFLLCAVNGAATHLATYDRHLTDLAPQYEFAIVPPALILEALDSGG